jgi:hypothetical protein
MKLTAFLATVATLGATPAFAQASGTSGMSTSSPASNVKAYVELAALGDCYAQYHRREALMMIATTPSSAEEEKAFDRYMYGEQVTCMSGGRMSIPIAFARGVLAQGLIRHGGVTPELMLAPVAPGQAKDLHAVARCYTSTHRAEVDALLRTQTGSKEEVSAVAALWPDFRTCMPGFKVRLNAPWIRFLLAEARLRLPPAGGQQ